jgi:hypothetical protein
MAFNARSRPEPRVEVIAMAVPERILSEVEPSTRRTRCLERRPDQPRRVAGASGSMWGLLVLSLAFLVGVQIYLHRHPGTDLPGETDGSSLPVLSASSPVEVTSIAALHLAWEALPAAAGYQLTIFTLTGGVVVDGLPVESTDWVPPAEAIPALPPGEYQWQAEAVDINGKVIASTDWTKFRVASATR